MTPCKNGQCELSVRRDGINKIVISSQTPLTDAQAEELFWCVGAMQNSGKTLKDLLKEQETVKPKKIKGYNPPMYTIYEYECEKCKSPMMNKQPFCMGCGRSVKWCENT